MTMWMTLSPPYDDTVDDDDLETLGGVGSGVRGHHTDRDRAARAIASYKPSTQAKQRLGARSVKVVSRLIGGQPTDDHAPMDVLARTPSGRLNGVEVKTLIDNKNDKITMHPESLARKEAWVKEHGANGHTVVVDRRGVAPAYYYHAGFGSFRVPGSMERVNAGELRNRIYGSRSAMSYYLYDANGYVADGPSVAGLTSLTAWAGDDPALAQFFKDGHAPPLGIIDALWHRTAEGEVEQSRQVLLEAARRASEVLILTDGSFEDLFEGLRDAEFDESKHPRDSKGQFGSGGGGGELSKPASAYTPSRPEGLDTRERFSDGHGHYTPERQALHEAIIAKYMAGTTPVESPTALILGGGMGAGKTTLVEAEGLAKGNTVDVNADKIRDDLPEYRRDASGKAPASTAFTHEEASDIAKELTTRAIDGKRNLTLDGTGDTTLQKLGGKVATMRAGGASVVAEYVTTSVAEAQARADERGAKIGRFVPPTAMAEAHRAVSTIFPEAIRQGLFDKARLWDTSGPRGSRPVLVASAQGKNVTIHDQAKWESFLAKGR